MPANASTLMIIIKLHRNGVFAEAEQTENHAQDSYRHEEQCNAGTHQPAYRVGITCNHNFARFLGGNATRSFRLSCPPL